MLLIAHPNVWYAHGPWQLRNWLADTVRAGLTVIDPLAGWQQAILASDVLIGDHGAVTGYAAALGIPTILGTSSTADIVGGTAIDMLVRRTPRLDPSQPIRGQLHAAMDHHPRNQAHDIAGLISTMLDRSAYRLRALFYRLLALPEPTPDPPIHPYPSIDLPIGPPAVTATLVQGSVEQTSQAVHVQMQRLPADVLHHRSPLLSLPDGHLVVHSNHPSPTLRAQAGILYCDRKEIGADERDWLSETHSRWPACVLAAVIDLNSCTVYAGPSRMAEVDCSAAPAVTPMLFASAIYLWLADGNEWDDLPVELSMHHAAGIPPAVVSVSVAPSSI